MKKHGLVTGLMVLCGGWLAAPAAHAQAERSARIDLHPVEMQVGMVSRTLDKTAWVSFPRMVKTGANVAFTAFSDGSDILAVGTVRWVTSLAPYEAYVTDIHAITTRHNISEFDDLFTVGPLTKLTVKYGTRPEDDPMGVSLTAGFFARAKMENAPESTNEVEEPVRANIADLHAQKSRLATTIATAAEKALGFDPTIAEEDQVSDYAVNYSALSDNLRAFTHLKITDPITEKILNRLLELAHRSGHASSPVPANFLRSPKELGITGTSGTGGLGGGTGTGTVQP